MVIYSYKNTLSQILFAIESIKIYDTRKHKTNTRQNHSIAPHCAFHVNGDSMEPTYSDGEIVLVQRYPHCSDLKQGDIGAFIVGNIKSYHTNGHSLSTGQVLPKPYRYPEARNVF